MNTEKNVEIAYAIHDHFGDYYEYLGISMLSVMESTAETLRFHILCDETLTAQAREQLCSMCSRYGHPVLFYEIVLDERISILELLRSGYNEGILYRLYLPELLPQISKILYLDADILAHGDIRELWEIDVTNCAAAGRWDPPFEGFKRVDASLEQRLRPFWNNMDWNQYVNSGVLVLNLERIRKEHRLLDEAVAFWDTYGMAFPDQDAINYILRGKIRHLPAHLNMPSKDLSVEKNGVLYHYSYCRGLNDAMSPVDKLYLSYWQRSPFYKPEYGKHDKAMFLMQLKNRLDVYLRLEKLQPLDKEEAFHLGRCLYLRGCFQEAYESLLNDKIDTTREWKLDRAYWLSLSLESLQRKPEAISLIQQTLTGCAEKPYMEHDIREMGLSNLAGRLCYEEKQYEEAVSALKQCLFFGTEEKRAVAVCALQYLIKCTIRIGDFAAAERYHNMLSTLEPMNESVKLSGLRLAYEKQRRMQD